MNAFVTPTGDHIACSDFGVSTGPDGQLTAVLIGVVNNRSIELPFEPVEDFVGEYNARFAETAERNLDLDPDDLVTLTLRKWFAELWQNQEKTRLILTGEVIDFGLPKNITVASPFPLIANQGNNS